MKNLLMASIILVALATTALAEPEIGVRINELMYDPEGKDLDEWVELFNEGEDVSIQGWWITDNEADHKFYLPDIVLSGGSFLVIHTCSGDLEVRDGVVHQYLDLNGNLWTNNGDDVALFDSGGRCLDYIGYGDSRYKDPAQPAVLQIDAPSVREGYSIALMDGVWMESLPTPGMDNELDPGTITALCEICTWSYPNSCRPIMDQIMKAEEEIKIAIYSFSNPEIIDRLIELERRNRRGGDS